jgi:predicted DNA-binding transcriptional regulator AlpA
MTPRMKTPSLKRRTKTTKTKTAEVVADISLKDDVILGTAAAAELVGQSQKTLRQMRCERTGPRFFKLGTEKQSRAAYFRSDLEAWVRSRIVAVGGQS